MDSETTQQCWPPKHPAILSPGLTWTRHPCVSTRQFPMGPNMDKSKGVGWTSGNKKCRVSVTAFTSMVLVLEMFSARNWSSEKILS